MKLIVDRSILLKSLGHMQSVVERRNTVEILSNIRIEAADDSVSLHATDMDLEGYKRVPALVTEGGVTTVPAHMLFEIVKKLPDGSQIEISHHESDPQVCIRSGRSRFSLSCLPAENFPIMDNGGDFRPWRTRAIRMCFKFQQIFCVPSLTGLALPCQPMKRGAILTVFIFTKALLVLEMC